MGLKTYGVVLEKEFENLNMVLMLSHFGLQVMDTGEPLSQAAPPHSPCPTQPSRSSLASKIKATGDSWPLTCSQLHSPISSRSALSYAASSPRLCAGCGGGGVEMNMVLVIPNPSPGLGTSGRKRPKAPGLER